MDNFLNSIRISEITDVFTVKWTKDGSSHMVLRPDSGIAFCKKGTLQIKHGNKSFIADPSSITFFPKYSDYYLKCLSSGIYYVVNFNCTNDNLYNEFTHHYISSPEWYTKLFKVLEKNFINNKSGIKAVSTVYELFSHLIDERCMEVPIVSSAIKYIENNFWNADLDNSNIAKNINISEVYLRKLFKSNLGKTPKQYILGIRMNHAKYLLLSGSESITKISEKCGFSSIYYFCTAFNKHFGQTPSEYRKANRSFEII